MKHLVVIPTYNEAENIKQMIEKIFGLYPNTSILVVDDSSPDGTSEIVNSLKTEYKNLFLLLQAKKSGLAGAYINGFKWGMENGFDLFTSIDCDFSHPAEEIKTAIELINKGADLACGSRYMPKGNTDETNFYKNFISIGGNIYARIILGKKLYDWTEGFNTFTKNCLEKINLDTITAKGYVFGAEMKYRAFKKDCEIKEFPINFQTRTAGKSKMSYKIVLEAFFKILQLRFTKLK